MKYRIREVNGFFRIEKRSFLFWKEETFFGSRAKTRDQAENRIGLLIKYKR